MIWVIQLSTPGAPGSGGRQGVKMGFVHLKSKAAFFRDNPEHCKTKEGLIDLACRDCDFWREDERDYECAALALLRLLLEKDVLSIDEVVRAVSE